MPVSVAALKAGFARTQGGTVFRLSECAAPVRALPDYLKDFVEFAYICGTRKRQLALTTWAHWNAEAAELTWEAAEVKSKLPHVLPLDGRAREIIEVRHVGRKLHCRYVFHGPYCSPGRTPSKQYGCVGDFKKAWTKACKAAGFPIGRKAGGFVFHNTRHTAVTNLVNAGVPAHEAQGSVGAPDEERLRQVLDPAQGADAGRASPTDRVPRSAARSGGAEGGPAHSGPITQRGGTHS